MRAWEAEKVLRVEPDALQRLGVLLALWQRYGRAMNLTASLDEASLIEHVIDGLDTAECAILAGSRDGLWVDVGSGGGFPGLVLVALRQWSLRLVEPRARRVAFLELAVGALGGGASVCRARWNGSTWSEKSVDGDLGRVVDVMSARAVFAPEVWLSESTVAAASGALVLVHSRAGISPEPRWRRASCVVSGLGMVEGWRLGA